MAPPRLAASKLERELAQDLRRSVLCGELNWGREAVDDGWDQGADVALVSDREKPVATGRLLQRSQRWWLDLVAVLPRHRRQGLGRELAAFLAGLAREKGADSLWVLAPPPSVPFFQACGFVRDQGDSELCLMVRNFN
ncbi:MAG TPA: GNAT family N-acetyltransferase [bacterium]|jgi:GNAT superfamily N-acetyltransferase|nr:GNAT family N-acetyltransferase [bacterium]